MMAASDHGMMILAAPWNDRGMMIFAAPWNALVLCSATATTKYGSMSTSILFAFIHSLVVMLVTTPCLCALGSVGGVEERGSLLEGWVASYVAAVAP